MQARNTRADTRAQDKSKLLEVLSSCRGCPGCQARMKMKMCLVLSDVYASALLTDLEPEPENAYLPRTDVRK